MLTLSLSNKKLLWAAVALASSFALSSCAPYQARRTPLKHSSEGIASWYGPGFHGRKTASGERYNQRDLTAAHKTLPFGSTIRVMNIDNGKSVVVRINDRGPFVRGRIIDLSRSAAEKIGMMGSGTARVKLASLSSVNEERSADEETAAVEKPAGKRGRKARARTAPDVEKPVLKNGVAWVISQEPQGESAEELQEIPSEGPETGPTATTATDDEQF